MESYYHIYNRGNNREDLFKDPGAYPYFLKLARKHILPVAQIYCWCLLPNHFHFLARIRSVEEQDEYFTRQLGEVEHAKPFKVLNPSQGFSNAFSSFAQAVNKRFDRTGSLFQKRFRRIEILDYDYMYRLVDYIHLNPSNHGIIENSSEYEWSSLDAFLDVYREPELHCHPLDIFNTPHDYYDHFLGLNQEDYRNMITFDPMPADLDVAVVD